MLDLLFHFMDSCINYSQVMEHQTQRGETLKNGHELKEIHEKKKEKKSQFKKLWTSCEQEKKFELIISRRDARKFLLSNFTSFVIT